MRIFIGIDFSKELKKEIAEIQACLKNAVSKARWKHWENMHLTLKFLGEIEEKILPEIKKSMFEACRGMKSFKLSISDIGHFSGRDCMRVLWLGIDEDRDSLFELQRRVENALVQHGFSREKRAYSPHITIGQDVVPGVNFDETVHNIKDRLGSIFYVNSICIFKSEQVGPHRVYTVLERIAFDGENEKTMETR